MVENDLRQPIANDSELEANFPLSKFLSPHDAVLARMHGEPLVGNEDVSLRDRDATQSADGLSPAESYSTTNNLGGNHQKEILYDPFDGTPLGLLVPSISQDHSQNRLDSKKRGIESENNEQWVHLSQVLDLQSEIAKMHLDMEAIGSSDGKGKGAVKGRQAKTKVPGNHGWERRDHDEVSGMQGGLEKREDTTDEDEEGVDTAGDEENERKRARETEFANLAEHFAHRNKAVGEIMDKLDNLSRALTDFHSLQAPQFEFSKATSTTPDSGTPPLSQMFAGGDVHKSESVQPSSRDSKPSERDLETSQESLRPRAIPKRKSLRIDVVDT